MFRPLSLDQIEIYQELSKLGPEITLIFHLKKLFTSPHKFILANEFSHNYNEDVVFMGNERFVSDQIRFADFADFFSFDGVDGVDGVELVREAEDRLEHGVVAEEIGVNRLDLKIISSKLG
jgi:hypothetical protein